MTATYVTWDIMSQLQKTMKIFVLVSWEVVSLIIIVSKAQSRPSSHLGHEQGISGKKPCQGQLYRLV